MFRPTAALAALTIAGSLAVATPADAVVDSYGVNTCTAISTNETRGRCTMITTPGLFTLELVANARYSWARVQCQSTGTVDLLWTNLWNTDPNYPHESDRAYLPGGQCLLTVAADEGTASGYVHP